MGIKKSEELLRYNRLKIVLAERNVSQKELSKMVDVDPNTITRICNNKSQPSMQLLFKIAIALEIDVRELLNPVSEIRKFAGKVKKETGKK
jgi:putative transcriptional regulator